MIMFECSNSYSQKIFHNSRKFLENSKNNKILRIRMLVNTSPGLI